jgi:type II secretory pathway pseudopilin PulG
MSGKKLINGFTLIELLIVVTLTIMLMLAASSLFMTFLLGNTRTTSNQLLRQEGNYAATQIEFLLRNAVEILPNSLNQTCQADMDEIKLKSYDNGVTTIMVENEKIASNSGVYLTSTAAELVDGPTFNCSLSPDRINHYIEFSFTLRKGIPAVDQDKEITIATFSGAAQLRSF